MSDEKWCVVLGATAGSGAAIAHALAQDPGLCVFGVHRGNHPEGAKALEDGLRGLGRRVHFHVGDASSEEAAQAGAEALRSIAGPGAVRILVHSLACASIGEFVSDNPKRRFVPKQLNRSFEAMAHSFVYWTRALLDAGLADDCCRFLALGNPLIEAPLPGCGVIAAAKAALETYVRYLALELGPMGHRVNCLRFGAVETPALQAVMERRAIDSLRPILEASTPAGRLVKLEEVAGFVSVLAGEQGAWFNGAIIDLTGGESLGHYAAQVERLRRT